MSRLEALVGAATLSGASFLIDRIDSFASTLIACGLAIAAAFIFSFKVLK